MTKQICDLREAEKGALAVLGGKLTNEELKSVHVTNDRHWVGVLFASKDVDAFGHCRADECSDDFYENGMRAAIEALRDHERRIARRVKFDEGETGRKVMVDEGFLAQEGETETAMTDQIQSKVDDPFSETPINPHNKALRDRLIRVDERLAILNAAFIGEENGVG